MQPGHLQSNAGTHPSLIHTTIHTSCPVCARIVQIGPQETCLTRSCFRKRSLGTQTHARTIFCQTASKSKQCLAATFAETSSDAHECRSSARRRAVSTRADRRYRAVNTCLPENWRRPKGLGLRAQRAVVVAERNLQEERPGMALDLPKTHPNGFMAEVQGRVPQGAHQWQAAAA